MRFTRRLDTVRRQCLNDINCPSVIAVSTGDVGFIGRVAPPELRNTLPVGSGVGDGEELVILPRDVLISAGWTPPLA
jgi:hypothetical protein